MRFDNLKQLRTLAILVLFFFPLLLTAQVDDFVDDENESPNVDGIFDDGFEPLDETAPEPVAPPSSRITDNLNRNNNEQNFDEAEEIEDSGSFDPVRRPSRFTRPSSPTINRGRNLNEPERVLNFAEDIPNPNEKLRMDFIQVDIEEVVKYFSERLRKKFIYDPAILSGKITIISPTEVSVYEAYQAFLSAMEIRGYAVYPTGAYLKIEKVNNARKSPVPLYTESLPMDDSYVTRIINLKYLNVGDIRRAVQDLVSRTGGDVIEHSPTNTLIVSDYASNIRRIIRILNILDVEGFQEQIAVINLQYASATDIARKISEIFPTGGSSAPTARRTTRRSARSTASPSSSEGVIQKVVADDRTNSLIILGSERGIEQVQKFISQIDVPVSGGDGQIHVYPLQNVKAEDLAQTLANLTSGSSGSNTNLPRSAALARGAANPAATQNQTGATANLFDGDLKITADPRTNSLVIQSSSRDFEVLKGIIRQLDIRRRQVFIESVILETTIGGRSEFGTSARGPLFRTDALGRSEGQTAGTDKSYGGFGFGGINNDTLAGTLSGLLGSTAITGLALGFQSGGTIEVPVPGTNGNDSTTQRVPLLTAIIRLSANNDRLNVLSTPHILATANEEATISIGEEIPQIASQQSSDAGNVISNFNRIRVATELNITPQINSGDYLTLTIKQKVNDRGAEVIPNSGQIATNTREATTTAIVKDGQTIVIGGIMRDRKVESVSKVPFLGDIPILGWLFKSRTSDTNKVNLLLFITPHIIRDTGDMNDVFFRKLKDREQFLKGIGVKEKDGVPISGFRPEDLEFLDEDYVKSLKLNRLPSVIPESSASPTEVTDPFPVPEVNAPNSNEPVLDAPTQTQELKLIPILPPRGTSNDVDMDSGFDSDLDSDRDFDSNSEFENDSNSDAPRQENQNELPMPEPLELSPLPAPSDENIDDRLEDFELPELPELEIPEN